MRNLLNIVKKYTLDTPLHNQSRERTCDAGFKNALRNDQDVLMETLEVDKENIINDFWGQYRKEQRSLSKRDNCGYTAWLFIEYLESKDIAAKKVCGHFIADHPVNTANGFRRRI